ncbi:DUF1638 domain-containing protein [Desulfoglaeba alkanexedens]|uniref:DUF1638 domain-containing protein n=1 Tax=Desulfoglaeba alkanexedens ALDC TaxID=980445 RepID=A0A4P8L2X0_9BACT|nr:DUF1638 domain-containing protein [Desulfoglaeba alkanexedens]QCQ22276.1 DUF1638 domain-containing protein [Desulfoglaeba alkanexedens ALDC]
MKTLVACRIFEDELQACLGADHDVHIIWLDAALHADLDRLAAELRAAIDTAKASGGPVQLLFGGGCHPDLTALAGNLGIIASPYKNCIAWLVGDRIGELEKNRTMLMTPAWVRVWPAIMAAMGWNEIDARMQLGRYDRILVLDVGLNSLTDEEIIAFFDLVQVPVEIQLIELTEFCDRLREITGCGAGKVLTE